MDMVRIFKRYAWRNVIIIDSFCFMRVLKWMIEEHVQNEIFNTVFFTDKFNE